MFSQLIHDEGVDVAILFLEKSRLSLFTLPWHNHVECAHSLRLADSDVVALDLSSHYLVLVLKCKGCQIISLVTCAKSLRWNWIEDTRSTKKTPSGCTEGGESAHSFDDDGQLL